ncbi:MAG: DMT family transporter [Proteobacteria bacterium]|nr:DMT family transporter [Pseudomonadota bacterium]
MLSGPTWLVSAMATITVMSALVRIAAEGLHPFVVVFFATALTAVAMVAVLRRQGLPILPRRRIGRYLIRAVFDGVAFITWYCAVSSIPLAEATALFFTLPLFVVVLAATILGETIGWRRWTAVALGFAGAMIVLRPDMVALELGALAALLAALTSASSNVMVRSLARDDPPVAVMGRNMVLLMPIPLAAALTQWTTPTAPQFVWLIAIAILAGATQFFLTRAYAATDASQLAPFQFTQLVFAALVGYAAFGELPDRWTVAGGALIAVSAIYIALREARLAKVS